MTSVKLKIAQWNEQTQAWQIYGNPAWGFDECDKEKATQVLKTVRSYNPGQWELARVTETHESKMELVET